MASAEQGGNFQKDNYQLAKEAKEKLIDKTKPTTEWDIKDSRWASDVSLNKIRIQSTTNVDRLEATVNEIPELQEYLNRGGRVTVAREYLPRLGRPRARISLTKEGVVFGRVGKGGNEFPLTGNMNAAEAEPNGAIDALGSLSSREVIERVAHRIDPDTTRNKLMRKLNQIFTQK